MLRCRAQHERDKVSATSAVSERACLSGRELSFNQDDFRFLAAQYDMLARPAKRPMPLGVTTVALSCVSRGMASVFYRPCADIHI